MALTLEGVSPLVVSSFNFYQETTTYSPYLCQFLDDQSLVRKEMGVGYGREN